MLIGEQLEIPQIATPSVNPASGFTYLYIKSDGNLYYKTSAGVETIVVVQSYAGLSTVTFVSFLPEDSITVTGQTGITSTSNIRATIYADNDDVYAQDWETPLIRNVVAGTGFDIVLRPFIGQFKGGVKVNWSWN